MPQDWLQNGAGLEKHTGDVDDERFFSCCRRRSFQNAAHIPFTYSSLFTVYNIQVVEAKPAHMQLTPLKHTLRTVLLFDSVY